MIIYPPRRINTEYLDDYTTLIAYAPTQSLLQKWLREEHSMHIVVDITITKEYYFSIYDLNQKRCAEIFPNELRFKGFKQALEKGLQEALKLIS